MNRKDEVKESIEYLNHIMDVFTKEPVIQEQITNYCLSAITHQLADISLTLAIIADKLGGESEGDDNATNNNG